MLQRIKLPLVSEIPPLEDDATLFEPSPEWFIPGLKPARGEDDNDHDDLLGFRSLIEEPDALADAWRITSGE